MDDESDPILEPGSTGQRIESHVEAAAARLLLPLARLFIAHGVKFGQAEELLKAAFVQAGVEELRHAGTEPNQSRVSLGTGVHRKDVRRLLQPPGASAGRRAARSVAAEVYTRWTTSPQYRHAAKDLSLPMRRDDDGPSFERLAREVSTDAHPRSVFEELRRLGLAESEDDAHSVRLTPGGFVPLLERSELLGLLADNTGAHLSTAVANVLGRGPRRLEQSVFEHGLSAQAVEAVDAAARVIWDRAMQELVQVIESLTDSSVESAGAPAHRVRVGMYTHSEPEE
jgi:hypothetical protein